MKLVKKSLGLVLMLGLAIGEIALTGCKKKTSENITTQKTTTEKKEYSFNDVWKVLDGEQSKYEAVIKLEADSSNLLSTGNSLMLTARKKVKIKKISYTAKNTSESTQKIAIPLSNGNYVDSNNTCQIATFDTDPEKHYSNLSQNETRNVLMTYDNFTIEKGQKFMMGFFKESSSTLNFYNFVIEFEVIE